MSELKSRTFNITTMIEVLSKVREEHGNMPIVLIDAGDDFKEGGTVELISKFSLEMFAISQNKHLAISNIFN